MGSNRGVTDRLQIFQFQLVPKPFHSTLIVDSYISNRFCVLTLARLLIGEA
jgi:hypothetical protein